MTTKERPATAKNPLFGLCRLLAKFRQDFPRSALWSGVSRRGSRPTSVSVAYSSRSRQCRVFVTTSSVEA